MSMYNTDVSILCDDLDSPQSVSILSLPYDCTAFDRGSLDLFTPDLEAAKKHVDVSVVYILSDLSI